jgi:translation initiation factor 3 subunit F
VCKLLAKRTSLMASLLLPTAQFGGTVKVQPVVLFSVCDAYIRRSEKQERVIGTLLGTVSDNVIDVKSCYVVPHNESQDQVGAYASANMLNDYLGCIYI